MNRVRPPVHLLVLGMAVLALAALGVSAWFLGQTQADQRHDLGERYIQRTTVASALVDALFRVAFTSAARDASERFAGAGVTRERLDRQVAQGQASYAFVLDISGRLLGRSSHTPPGVPARVANDHAFLGAALRNGYAISDVVPGGPTGTVRSAMAFRTPDGVRLLITGQSSGTYDQFLSGTLRPLPTLRGSMSFVLDRRGTALGSADQRGGRPVPPRAAVQAGEAGQRGSYKSPRGKVFVATSPIPRTPFKIVLTAPERELYASVSGLGRWAPWIILVLGAAALAGVALLLRQLMVANAELDASRRDLEIRARELERSNADLEQFAYAASHDLSEPLRTVAGFSQLLHSRYQGRLDRDADEYIAHMTAGVERMQQLIDDLLVYSRVGREPLREEDVDLEDVLRQVLNWIAPALREREARVTHDPLPAVRGERGQIAQVLQNLVANAVKFTGPDVEPEVHVSAAPEGRSWRISVRDNGIGVDGANDVIFKMFGRLHPVDTYPGTGIGLALAKRIVEGHGGQIWVEPAPGGGSVFSFTLPAAVGAERHAVGATA
ncbi:MAG TPA: ATP-binding protein [Solirubrobacteraceae bacterium]